MKQVCSDSEPNIPEHRIVFCDTKIYNKPPEKYLLSALQFIVFVEFNFGSESLQLCSPYSRNCEERFPKFNYKNRFTKFRES